MIIGIKNSQDRGKTLLGVRHVLWLVAYGGYEPSECYGNLAIKLNGFNACNNDELIRILKKMVAEEWRHKIIFLDEVDRVFPPRFWTDKEQTKALLGLWQDVKLFNVIIWTAHLGSAVDILLRETTQVQLIPFYSPEKDCIEAGIISTIDMEVDIGLYTNISEDFEYYDRWEVVK